MRLSASLAESSLTQISLTAARSLSTASLSALQALILSSSWLIWPFFWLMIASCCSDTSRLYTKTRHEFNGLVEVSQLRSLLILVRHLVRILLRILVRILARILVRILVRIWVKILVRILVKILVRILARILVKILVRILARILVRILTRRLGKKLRSCVKSFLRDLARDSYTISGDISGTSFRKLVWFGRPCWWGPAWETAARQWAPGTRLPTWPSPPPVCEAAPTPSPSLVPVTFQISQWNCGMNEQNTYHVVIRVVHPGVLLLRGVETLSVAVPLLLCRLQLLRIVLSPNIDSLALSHNKADPTPVQKYSEFCKFLNLSSKFSKTQSFHQILLKNFARLSTKISRPGYLVIKRLPKTCKI